MSVRLKTTDPVWSIDGPSSSDIRFVLFLSWSLSSELILRFCCSQPIPIIVAVSNVLPALKHILSAFHSDATNYLCITNSILCTVSVLGIFFLDHNLSVRIKSVVFDILTFQCMLLNIH